jgi:predicted nucleotidyltransferase
VTKENILNAIDQHKDELRKFGVKRLGIFGSCVRNEADQASDVDVLVELKDVSLSTYVKVKHFLESLFGRKVDLVLSSSLKPNLKNRVLKEVVYAEGI